MIAVKKLKQSGEFTVMIDALDKHMCTLDKHMRASVEPNQLLKISGMSKQLEDILDSIKSV